jgi:hypothetical protein
MAPQEHADGKGEQHGTNAPGVGLQVTEPEKPLNG